MPREARLITEVLGFQTLAPQRCIRWIDHTLLANFSEQVYISTLSTFTIYQHNLPLKYDEKTRKIFFFVSLGRRRLTVQKPIKFRQMAYNTWKKKRHSEILPQWKLYDKLHFASVIKVELYFVKTMKIIAFQIKAPFLLKPNRTPAANGIQIVKPLTVLAMLKQYKKFGFFKLVSWCAMRLKAEWFIRIPQMAT